MTESSPACQVRPSRSWLPHLALPGLPTARPPPRPPPQDDPALNPVAFISETLANLALFLYFDCRCLPLGSRPLSL